MKKYHLIQIAVLLIGLLGTASWAAPPTSGPAGAGSLSKKLVESKLKETEAATDLDEQSKTSLTELYRKILSNLEATHTGNASTQQFIQARENAAGEAVKLNATLEKKRKHAKPVDLKISAKTPLADLEQMLLKEKADYAAVDAKLSGLNDLLDQENARPVQARKQLTDARQQLEVLNTQLQQAVSNNASDALAEAQRWNLQSRVQALNAEINRLDQELLSQPMRLQLIKAQRDTAAYNLSRISERIKLLEDELNQRRRSLVEKARATAESATGETQGKHPLIRKFARQITELSNQLTAISNQLEQVTSGDQAANDEAKRIEEEFRRTEQKLEVAGLSQALGQILLEQRRLLPNIRQIRRAVKARGNQIAENALSQIQLNDELRRLRDPAAFVDESIAELEPDEALAIRPDLLKLATTRRELLQKTLSTVDSYLRALAELDYAQERLITAVETYSDFLDERLLWVRSKPAPNVDMLLNTPAQVIEILSPRNWLGVVNTLLKQLLQSPIPFIVFAVAGILLIKKRRMVQILIDSGKKIIKPRSDRFRYTLLALVLTLLVALPWPMIFWTAGWMLSTSLDSSNFDRAVGHALMVLSPAFFYLSAFRSLCRHDGLAVTHFRWSAVSTQALRREVGILTSVFLPAALVAVISIRSTTMTEGALGRLAFVVFICALSWFFYRLFGPHRAVLEPEFRRHPESPLSRYRYLWLALSMVIPLLLIVLAVSGFLYTAGTLTGSLIDTLWLVLGFLVIHQTAVRWLLLVRRKLIFEAAVERRRAALAAQQDEPNQPAARAHDETELEEPEIDLIALNQESLKLLNSAIVFCAIISLWFIWKDVLPAFGRLDHIALWHYKGIIEGEEGVVPVTVADILLALLFTLVTVVGTRRFPALLEIVLLKRVSMTSGGRYTATTLARYSIAAIGALLVLNTVGVRWSQIQWMAAALSVGIGFGLQEIVANFISGLIILFERPIRVGDVVTVGDTDGIVTRIQIRATTIRTWDRQELLVPNKEFITGRLLNWSLSDQITRIHIPVGVAYGSDVQRAMALMREIAEQNALVLDDPKPYTIFTEFGDNTLNLELRCFVGNQEDRLPAKTQLHEAINDRFNESGIVIAFPQRDVHIDTNQPLEVRLKPTDR